MLKFKNNEGGFTLVELAVVMIIIGLLIGGVLKGQELVNNAQITATVAQIRGIDGAVSTFDDAYNGLPGDLARAGDRIPNCAVLDDCVPAGGTQGNRRLEIAFDDDPEDETIAFWIQLAAADLLTGIAPNLGAIFGGVFPTADVGGGYHVGFTLTADGANFPEIDNVANLRGGHYLALHATAGEGMSTDSVLLRPNQAQRIDTRLDDGNGQAGSVRSFSGDNDCTNGDDYLEADGEIACGLYIRIQQ